MRIVRSADHVHVHISLIVDQIISIRQLCDDVPI